MNKIPTLLIRDEQDRRYVTDEVTPGCEWVFEGEGVATRKYDGTCVMYDGQRWWARREVKDGKAPPPGFQPVQTDEATRKTVGWEPIEQSPFAKFHADALGPDEGPARWQPGTYELCGPRVNGNPEHYLLRHRLIRHAIAEPINLPPALDARTVKRAVRDLAVYGYEGIVWHHPDGRMAKLKARDVRETA